jgi:hypothetical protein
VTLEKPNKVAKTPSINKKGENVIFFFFVTTNQINNGLIELNGLYLSKS